MIVAANWFSAVSVISQQLGFVANPYLFHLDSRLKLAGQQLYQFTKIDSFVGQVKDNHPLAAEKLLNVNELHVQIELLNVLLDDFDIFLPSRIDVRNFVRIVSGD